MLVRPFFLLSLLLIASTPALLWSAPVYAQAEERAWQRRANFIIEQTAARDLPAMQAWFDRTSFFQNGGGDPHKFAFPGITARLYLDPTDEEAIALYRHLMEVDTLKSDRGLYHFAAFMRARLIFQLGDQLPADFIESTIYDVNHFFDIMRRGGTENHRFMHRASGLIFAERIPGDLPGSAHSRAENEQFFRDWLAEEGRLMFTKGSGEYDSSTYVAFTVASLANIYDFTEDPEIRQQVRAMLDWKAAGMAHKYFHGVNMGPEARGFARQAVGHNPEAPRFPGKSHFTTAAQGTHTDWISWLWWGGSAQPVAMGDAGASTDRYPSHILAMSSYRPPEVLRRLARKEVELPFEARGSKPPFQRSRPNKDQEVLYVDHGFSLTTLYSPESGDQTRGSILPQTTTFKILVRDHHAVHAFGAQNGFHGHFPLMGRSPHDQHHQVGASAINVCWVQQDEDDRTFHRSLFGFPREAGDPNLHSSGWFIWEIGDTFLGVYPLGAEPEIVADGDLRGHSRDHGYKYLKSRGTLGGWIVQLAGRDEDLVDGDAFGQALADHTEIDLAHWSDRQEVGFRNLAGETLRLRHSGETGGRPIAFRNDEEITYEDWSVWESPYIRQAIGEEKLTLSDGQQILVIRWNEGQPVYTESEAVQKE